MQQSEVNVNNPTSLPGNIPGSKRDSTPLLQHRNDLHQQTASSQRTSEEFRNPYKHALKKIETPKTTRWTQQMMHAFFTVHDTTHQWTKTAKQNMQRMSTQNTTTPTLTIQANPS